jgi:membrane fusion protein (multidrug efflux system)
VITGVKSMPKNKICTLVVMILIAAALGIQTGCGRTSHSQNNGKNEDVTVPVEVAAVTSGDIASYWTGTATLEAEKETEVVAKVSGVVKRIFVEEGDYVSAGQVLVKLDDEKIAVQMEQAKANLEQLRNDYDRAQELFEESLVSAQEFQRAKYDYESQAAGYDLCALDLEYTSIRSPISGVVAERLVKVGNMVLANTPVFRVTDPDPLLAVLHVPERQVGKLRGAQRATITVDALEGAEFGGWVERISPVVDPGTGTIKVTVEVRDASRSLKPGMFARINIVHDVHAGTILAPRDAVMEEDNESAVYVVSDSTAYRRVVQTGYVNSLHIEILEGLALGDTVVTTGKGSLKDSSRVDIVNAGPAPEVAEADPEPGTDTEGEATEDESAGSEPAEADSAAAAKDLAGQ